MPTYTFLDTDSGMEYDIDLRISELDEYKAKWPKHIQQIQPVGLVGMVGGIGRNTDSGWKDMLSTIKKGSGKGNTINV